MPSMPLKQHLVVKTSEKISWEAYSKPMKPLRIEGASLIIKDTGQANSRT
jgi:hypothetical protein